jgi:hypothetical protein
MWLWGLWAGCKTKIVQKRGSYYRLKKYKNQ